MNGFGKLLRALLIAGLIGTVAIVGAAQFLSIPSETPAMTAIAKALDAAPPLRDISQTLGEVLVFKERDSIAIYVDADGKPVPKVIPQKSQTTETAPVVVTTASSSTPEGINLPEPTSDGPNWGLVTADEARSFTTAGKPRERVRAGTSLVILSQKKSSIGECLECSLFPPGPRHGRFLVLKKDVMMFGGSPSDLPADALSLLVKKSKTLAALNQLKLDAESAHRKRNPHYRKYQTARADYLAYWKKVKSLQKARDGDVGSGHVNAEDELRQLKGEDIRVGTAYKDAKADYETWKNANPVTPVTNDPRYHSLSEQVRTLDAKLSAIPPAS